MARGHPDRAVGPQSTLLYCFTFHLSLARLVRQTQGGILMFRDVSAQS